MRILATLLFSAAGAISVAAPSNSIIIKNLQSSAQVARPFTVSRIFAQGEIPNFAQARIAGAPVLTQCDVKTRWPDGSLRHALVSFKGDLPAGGSLTVDFVNQTTGNNTGHLASPAAMLAPSWMSGAPSWDAEMRLDNGSTALVKNARAMLQHLAVAPGQIRYWMQGPIVTQAIVEDRTTALSDDIGFDSNRSLHPIFVLTFYNDWQGVKVEYIVENLWSTKLQDQTYAVRLLAGATPADVYTKAGFIHYARTRWHKTYWSGQSLDRDGSGNRKVNIDFNRAYLSWSKAIPNYDPARTPGSAALNGAYNAFMAGDRGDINGRGQFALDFGTTGGREEIGLYPTWEARYLASMDSKMYDVVMGNADVAGHVPIHLRESATTYPAQFFGRYLSLDARPTGPGVTMLTPGANSGWKPDLSHQSAFAFVPYLLTGDWYWMEEMQFWATNNGFYNDPGTCSYCRNAGMGVVTQSHQARGQAWAWRNMAHAAFSTPDADALDKAYFNQLLANNLGAYEGKLDIRDGAYFNTPQWKFGHDVVAPNGNGGRIGLLPDTLGFMNYNSSCSASSMGSYGLDSAKLSYCDAPWMNNYLRASFGRIIELGYPADKLLARSSLELIHTVLDPAVGNPYLAGSYVAPRTAKGTNLWVSTWTQYSDGWLPAQRAKRTWNLIAPSSDDNNPDNGYPHLARGAASFITGIADGPYSGQATYDWLNTNVNTGVLSDNPKWALIPRSGSSAPPPTVSQCDFNGDSKVDVADVQLAINATLGLSPAAVDLNGNGRADVVDVQRTVNSALGATCRVGP